jgi:hypothetical protein
VLVFPTNSMPSCSFLYYSYLLGESYDGNGSLFRVLLTGSGDSLVMGFSGFAVLSRLVVFV